MSYVKIEALKDEDLYGVKLPFDEEQEQILDVARRHGLNDDKIAILMDGYDAWQMRAIEDAFEDGLTIEQIKKVARHEFDGGQINALAFALESEMPDDYMSLISDSDFSNEQMTTLVYAFRHGLKLDSFRLIARPSMERWEMDVQAFGLKHYGKMYDLDKAWTLHKAMGKIHGRALTLFGDPELPNENVWRLTNKVASGDWPLRVVKYVASKKELSERQLGKLSFWLDSPSKGEHLMQRLLSAAEVAGY